MMDNQKKCTVLHYISAIWGETVETLLHLKNGHFYMRILSLLDQWNKKQINFETDKDRLACVKTFLQDYYGEDVRIDDFLKFDIILQTDPTVSENDIELELAKIAVVLLGVGVLDKNGQHFISAAMHMPPDMHFDVMAIIQSVVQAGSTEVCLTANIEKVLLEPADSQTQTNAEKLFTWLQISQNSLFLSTKEEQCLAKSPIKLSDNMKSPPICNLEKSHFMDLAQTSTPKDDRFCINSIAAACLLPKDSPLRTNISVLGHSLQEITSPMRGLCIDTTLPSSPLAQFVQSPQLIHKAMMKQKELELRKLNQMLNDQIDLKYELQFNLQDKSAECTNKDAEILKLQDRIKELLHMRDAYDELQVLKLQHTEMEREMLKLNKKLLSFKLYKDQCQILEKESHDHCQEVEKLHLEIEALTTEANKNRDSVKTITQLEIEVQSLNLQLEVMNKLKVEWEGERGALHGNLEMAKETIDELRHELEEIQIKQEENAPGESMGIFMDIQMGELRCQVEDLRQENGSLLKQLQELKTIVSTKHSELDQLRDSLNERDGIITEMNHVLRSKGEEIEVLQERTVVKEEHIEELKRNICSYESELEALKESNDQKDTQKTALEGIQCNLQEQVEVLNCRIQTICADHSDSKQQISSLTIKVSELENELRSQRQECISLSNTKSNLEEVLRKKEEELSSLQHDLSVNIEVVSKLLADKDTAQEHLISREMEIQNICQMNAKLKEEQIEVQEQLDAKSTVVDELTEALNLKNAEILDLLARELSFSEAAKYVQATCDELRDESEKYKQQLNSAESELQQTKCELISSENEVKELKESAHLKDEDLQMMDTIKCKLEQQVETLMSQIQAKMEECSEHMHRLASLTDKVSYLEQELQSQNQAVITLSKTKTDLEDILMNKDEEFGTLHYDLSISRETISKLEADNVTAQEHLRSKEVENDTFCKVNSKLKDEVSQVNEQLTATCTSVDELTEAFNTKCSELLDLKARELSFSEAEKYLQATCDELRAESEKYKQLLITTESELQQVKDQLAAGIVDLSASNEERNRLIESVEERSNLCRQLQDLVSQHSDETFKMENERDQVKIELIRSKNVVKELRESTHLKEEQLHRLDSVRCKLEEQVESLNSQIHAKMEECSQYKHREASLTEKASDLEKELQSQNKELMILSEIKSNFEDVLMKKEEELNNLHNELSGQNETISTLEVDNETAQDHLRRKEAENKNLCVENANLKVEAEQVQEQLTTKSTAVVELTEALNIKCTEVLDLESQRISLDKAKINLETLCEELRVDNEKYKQHLNSTELELQQVRDQMSAGNVELLVLKKDLNEMKASVGEKSSLCKELQDLVSQHSDELLKGKSERDQLKKELIISEKELNDSTHLKEEQLQMVEAAKFKLEEQIEVMHSQIKAKMEECSQYNHRVASLTEKVSDLEKELQSQSQDVITLTNTKSNLEEIMMKKDEELNRLHSDLSCKDEAISALEADKDTAQENLRSKEAENKNLCVENANLKVEAEQVQEQLTTKSTAVVELTEALNIKCTEVLHLESQRISLDKAKINLETLCEELNVDKEKYKQHFNRAESELQQVRDQMSAGNVELLALKGELKRLQASVDEKTSLCKELQDLVSQHSDALLQMENERDQLKNELVSSGNEMEELKKSTHGKVEQIEILEAVKCKLEEQIEIINCKMQVKEEEHSESIREVSNLTNKILELQDKVQLQCQDVIMLSETKLNLEEVVMKNEKDLNSLVNDLSMKSQAMSKLEADKDAALEHLRCREHDLCGVITQLRVEAEQVQEQLATKSAAVVELTEALNIKCTEVLDLESQRISLDKAKINLETLCEELRVDNEKYKQHLNSTELELQQVRDQMSAGNVELLALKEDLNEMKASVGEKSSLCKELQDLVSQHSDELLKVKSERDQLKNEFIISEKELKESTFKLEEQIEVMHSQIKAKMEECSQYNHRVASLTEKVSDLEKELQSQSQDVITLTNTKSNLEEIMMKKDEELNRLHSDLSCKDEAISILEADKDTAQENLRSKETENENLIEQLMTKTADADRISEALIITNAELLDKVQLLKNMTNTIEMNESRIDDLTLKLEKITFSTTNLQDEIKNKEHDFSQLVETSQEQSSSIGELTVILQSKESSISELNAELEKQAVASRLRTNENAELTEKLQANTRHIEDVRTQLKLVERELEEKNRMFQDVSDELVSKDAVLLEKGDELTKCSSDLHCVKDRLNSNEENTHLLETQLKEVSLSLQHTVEKLAESQKVMAEKYVAEQEMNNRLSSLTLALQGKSNEIAIKDSAIDSMKEQHKTECAQIKERTEIVLKCLQAKIMDARESEIHSLAMQKANFESEITSLRLDHERDLSEATQKIASSKEAEKVKLEQQVVEEYERKISTMEQSHSNQMAAYVTEKHALVEETKELTSRVAEIQENIKKSNEDHQKTVQELLTQQSCLIKEHQQQVAEQKVILDKEKQTFHKSLETKEIEIEKLAADKQNIEVQLAKLQFLIVQHERKASSLQEENKNFMERENKRLKESDAQMKTANEFCNTLRKQLDSANHKLESSEKEVRSLTEQTKCHEQQVMKMKDTNSNLANALKIERDTSIKMQKRLEGCTSKYEDLKSKYEFLQNENKLHASEVSKLKTALDYADRKLRQYQHQLDQAGTALLGDASHFKRIIGEKHDDSLDDSLDSRASRRALRSRLSSGSIGYRTILNETIISGDVVMLKREALASAGDLREKGLGIRQTEDRMSICSTSSAQSIKSLNGVAAACLPNAMSCANEPEGPDFEWDRLSELQRRNTLYLPHLKSAYPVEMQIVSKEKFSDDTLRLSLISNRRAKGSPSNYFKNKKVETSAKESLKETDSKSLKRKASVKQIGDETSAESPPKQITEISTEKAVYRSSTESWIGKSEKIRTAPVYQRPGPPTPGKQPRRISGRFTPSHGRSPAQGGKIKLLGSPIARLNPRQTHSPSKPTPRRSPRISPSASSVSSSNQDQRQETISFNIGFTPLKNNGPKKMMRQKAFVSKDKSSTTTAVTETATQLGKGRASQQQTGQVSFSASLHQDVSQIFANAMSRLGVVTVDSSKVLSGSHKHNLNTCSYTLLGDATTLTPEPKSPFNRNISWSQSDKAGSNDFLLKSEQSLPQIWTAVAINDDIEVPRGIETEVPRDIDTIERAMQLKTKLIKCGNEGSNRRLSTKRLTFSDVSPISKLRDDSENKPMPTSSDQVPNMHHNKMTIKRAMNFVHTSSLDKPALKSNIHIQTPNREIEYNLSLPRNDEKGTVCSQNLGTNSSDTIREGHHGIDILAERDKTNDLLEDGRMPLKYSKLDPDNETEAKSYATKAAKVKKNSKLNKMLKRAFPFWRKHSSKHDATQEEFCTFTHCENGFDQPYSDLESEIPALDGAGPQQGTEILKKAAVENRAASGGKKSGLNIAKLRARFEHPGSKESKKAEMKESKVKENIFTKATKLVPHQFSVSQVPLNPKSRFFYKDEEKTSYERMYENKPIDSLMKHDLQLYESPLPSEPPFGRTMLFEQTPTRRILQGTMTPRNSLDIQLSSQSLGISPSFVCGGRGVHLGDHTPRNKKRRHLLMRTNRVTPIRSKKTYF